MKEKYNFKIDIFNKSVSIDVAKSLFSMPAILHAAYLYIEKRDIIISEEGNKVIITFILDDQGVTEGDLEKLAFEFNKQLICSSVEDVESRKHAGVRDTMIRAALGLPQIQKGPKEKSN